MGCQACTHAGAGGVTTRLARAPRCHDQVSTNQDFMAIMHELEQRGGALVFPCAAAVPARTPARLRYRLSALPRLKHDRQWGVVLRV